MDFFHTYLEVPLEIIKSSWSIKVPGIVLRQPWLLAF